MTDDLQTLLRERAGTAALPAPDLGAITSAGRRRVRRRQGAGLLAGTAAAALVVGGYAVVADGSSPGRHDQVATDPVVPISGLTWTTGSTLHVDGQEFDLGHEVHAYVRTRVGYVFADADGSVWSASNGSVDKVGTVAAKHPGLIGDQDGALAGWIDPSGGAPVFAVLDQSNGQVHTFPAAAGTVAGTDDTQHAAVFEAIDDTTLYWRDRNGENVTALGADGHSSSSTQSPAEQVLAAEDGVQVRSDADGGQVSVRHSDGTTVELDDVYGSQAQLSPDAAYVNIDADAPAVYATDTGAQVKLDVNAFFADGFEWLDDHTLAVMALPTEHSDYELLTCIVPAGTCTVVVPHLGHVYSEKDPAPGFQLPVGYSIGQD